ncbi:terminase small subunit-like protein [Paraburkholderia caffeinilytica]|uniref:terminase small subunit-like protein n=1 Tax=Paraburkholderia caffeinilytica TaxID=1761016 RepID=UPI0038BB5939
MKFTNKSTQSIAQKPEAPAKTKAKKTRRRITNKGYSAAVYERLFEYVAEGEDLTKACRHPNMPHPATVRRRMLVDDTLASAFKTAQAIRLHGLADQMVRLPDEALEGYAKVSPADRLTAAKQKADSIRFLLTKGLADYQGIGEDGGQVTLVIQNAPDLPIIGAPAAPYVPAGQPVLKIVGGGAPTQSIAQPAEGKEAGNG